MIKAGGDAEILERCLWCEMHFRTENIPVTEQMLLPLPPFVVLVALREEKRSPQQRCVRQRQRVIYRARWTSFVHVEVTAAAHWSSAASQCLPLIPVLLHHPQAIQQTEEAGQPFVFRFIKQIPCRVGLGEVHKVRSVKPEQKGGLR